jgi:large subunit ribosomal protein L22
MAEFRAVHRHARITPRKARRVMDLIRGMSAGDALDTLKHDGHRAAVLIRKVLASAVANALQDETVRANRLMISRAIVNQGPLLMGRARFRPASMGRAMPYVRHTCHIHVHVADAAAGQRQAQAEQES